jgi:hypothetical protein
MASGGGSSCNPGGSCNPPFNGGGWSPRISIFGSIGTTHSGAALATWTSATAVGTCFTLTTTNGYATLYGLCSISGTSISWTTVNTCGDNVCPGSTPPPCGATCASCATACPACEFSSNPTVAQVTSTCPNYPFTPPIATGQTATRCHSFTAANTIGNFNIVITSTCGAGTVSAFSWTLQASSCGAIMKSGTISDLSFTGLTIGQQYTFCYTFTVPNPGPPTNNCTHSTHYPYVVGPEPLPIELVSFDAIEEKNRVKLTWSTSSEFNNDYFTIEKSENGTMFDSIATVKGAGNSQAILNYSTIDYNPSSGLVYYRLKQTDFDGQFKYSGIVTSFLEREDDLFTLNPNPSNGNVYLSFNCTSKSEAKVTIQDYYGRIVLRDAFTCTKLRTNKELETEKLPAGIYYVVLEADGILYRERFVKNE